MSNSILSPRSLIESAFQSLLEETSPKYVFTRLILLPGLVGFLIFYYGSPSNHLNFIGTVMAILAGFSINSIFALTGNLEFSNREGKADFFRSLRHYTSYSILVVLVIISVTFLMKILRKESQFLEFALSFLIAHYVIMLLIIIRRVDTTAKLQNF